MPNEKKKKKITTVILYCILFNAQNIPHAVSVAKKKIYNFATKMNILYILNYFKA